MAQKPACYVFGAGQPPPKPPKITARDLVVAADGGYAYIRKAGIRADALIGDFDSLSAVPDMKKADPIERRLPKKKDQTDLQMRRLSKEKDQTGLIVMRLPKEKDQTDLLAALQYGLERGFTRFHIYGGTGGRLDHTLANIQCLGYLVSRGARGYLHDGATVVTAMEGEIRLAARHRGLISVFALGGTAEGVWLSGLRYELKNARLSCDYPLGVSNEFTGLPVCIKAESGILLIVYPSGTRELE